MWAGLIAALISVLGPVLLEWLKKWLDNRLTEAAGELPEMATYGSEHEARDALFDRAIANLPRLAFARRGLLRRAKAAAAKAGVTSSGPESPLTAADFEDLADAAGAANNE